MFYLRDIREQNKLTMKELGKLVGLSESAIGMYETEKRKPNYEMLLKLSEALGCSVNDLVHGVDYDIQAKARRTVHTGISLEEYSLIESYRNASDGVKEAVCKLLDI